MVRSSAAEPTYWQDVRAALRRYCTVCHSTKNLKEVELSGGLALDTYEGVVKNTKKPLLHVGKSDESLIVQLMITNDTEKRMPLGVRPAPAETIDLIRRWIDTGAKEGTRPDPDPGTTVTTKPRKTRKFDVLLPTTTTPPAGALGKVPTAPLKLSLKVGPLAPATAVTFSPDGKFLATGAYGRVTIWELDGPRPVKVLTNVLGSVNALRFSPDGKTLAVAGGQPSARGDLRLFQVSDWKLLTVLAGHDDVVSSIAFDRDGKRLASASFDKTVRIWDLKTLKLERALTGHSDFVYAVAFSPDGSWLASTGKDRSVKVVETETGKSRFTFSGFDKEVFAVAVSNDGQSVVASGEEPGLSWYSTKTGERLRVQTGHGVGVNELAFSRDGKVVVSAGADGTVRLWDGSTGAPVRTVAVGAMVYATALSPDSKRVVSAGADGLVRLWDTATGRPLVALLSLPPRDERHDWLALTPEGYAAGSPALLAEGQWLMGTQKVESAIVWKTLTKPESVARAARGETVAPPVFDK